MRESDGDANWLRVLLRRGKRGLVARQGVADDGSRKDDRRGYYEVISGLARGSGASGGYVSGGYVSGGYVSGGYVSGGYASELCSFSLAVCRRQEGAGERCMEKAENATRQGSQLEGRF